MLIAATLIAATLLGPTVPAYVQDGYNAPAVESWAIPRCHEDEVIVRVIAQVQQDAPGVVFGLGDMVGMFGCVPADNLPVTGFRP